MFKERLLSGIVLVILMTAVLYAGGLWTLGAIFLLSVIGLREFYRLFKLDTSIFVVFGYLFTVAYYLILFLKQETFLFPLFIVFFMAVMIIYVFSFPKYKGEQAMTSFFGFVYTVILLSYIYRIRMLEGGGAYVVLAFLSSWGNDTFAYCVGRLIGKHKMSPKLRRCHWWNSWSRTFRFCVWKYGKYLSWTFKSQWFDLCSSVFDRCIYFYHRGFGGLSI